LLAEASIALKIAALAFVLGIVGSVLNSPMLARLRMDLNTLTSAVPKVLLAVVTPLILYYGGGLVGAVSWAFTVGAGALVAILCLSRRLLPELLPPTFSPAYVPRLLTFGSGLVLGGLAGILLVNFEKLALSRLTSVTSLAYYSVAYTLANIAMLFSMSMTQSLIPAFSQLLLPANRTHLNALFASTIRLTIVVLLPSTVLLLVLAKPFFTLWAGEDFGKESTLPFYVLLIGVAFNMLAFIQHSLITSTGRTRLLAKIYWIEFIFYVFISIALIHSLGIVGAALAWTIRVVADAVVFIVLGDRLIGVSFRLHEQLRGATLPLLVLAPLPFVVAYGEGGPLVAATTFVCLLLYAILTWKKYLREAERTWLQERIARLWGAQPSESP
jgi:O-antigen/teichoic acid export membrane protein